MPDPEFLRNRQWKVALVTGIVGIVFGISFILFTLTVLQKAFFITFFVPVGYVFIGFGLGYIVCSKVFRELEMNIHK